MDFEEIDKYYTPLSTVAADAINFDPDTEFYTQEFEAVIRTKRFSVAGLDGIPLRFLIPLIRASRLQSFTLWSAFFHAFLKNHWAPSIMIIERLLLLPKRDVVKNPKDTI